MENVWTDFKTDEETFKLIMKYEENFVKTIVQKKYGINYDNKDEVKLTKKENEIFALASLLIEIDVLCIKNLKNKHINVDSFFKKEEGLMQRKICTAYDLKIDKLENIIIRLPEEQRKVFIYSYGINRRKMNFKDIEKLFEVSTDDIYKNLLLTIRRLKSEVNIMKSVKKVTNKIPTMLMLDLEKRGYPRSELIEALNLYDDKTKYTLQKYYGFNYSSAKSLLIPVAEGDEEIINSVLTGDNNIDVQIKKLQRKKLQAIEEIKRNNRLKKEKTFNLIKFYKNKGYSALEFLNAYRSLSERQCALIKKKYDNEFNEIKDAKLSYKENAMIFELTRSERSGIGKILAETTNKTMPKIIKIVEQPQEVEKEILEKKNEEVIQPIKVEKTPTESKDITLPQKSNTFDSVEKKDVNFSPSKDLTENKPNNEKGIKNFDTFNEYCKSLGFDDEDMEILYSSLKENPTRHDRFYRLFNITEKEKHMFIFKTPAADLCQKDQDYLTKDIPISLCKYRLKTGRSIEDIKLQPSIKRAGERAKTTPTISIKKYKTLNDFIKAIGFDDEDLEEVYNSLTEREKDIFSETINVTETEDKKHIFTFIRRIDKNVEKSYKYYNKTILVKLYRCRVKNNKSIDNLNLTENVKRYIELHSPKTSSMEIVNDYKTMPKIIKIAEQPQEAEKEILEKKNEEVIQPIKVKKTPTKSKDITLPQKSNTFDSVEKKGVNFSPSKDLTENKPNNEKGIKNFDTFNEYCKSLGFDDEDLENMYNELSAKEKERFNKCIIVTEDAEKKHTFTFTKRITQNHDQLNYQYYTQSVIIRLYRGRLRNNKSVDNIEVSKNVKNHLRTNSIRGNNTPKIENYIHLNGYYNALGFDDEDMENLYSSLDENPIRHDCFYRLFNIIEDEKHMFIFTKPAADLCQKDHDYLTKDIPISLCKFRIKKGKGVDNIKLPPSIKKSGERVKTTPTISIKKYKTLNGFIKAIGFDDEDLEEVYKNLIKREKDIFSETINVTETKDKKHIFTFVRRIDTNDKRNYKYYNKTILVKLYRCRVKNNKSIENLNLTENIKRYIDFHSPKTSRMEIINDYKTLNDYYKSLGFDDEDMEDLYLSLASIPFRHDYFYKTMNIVEEAENKHIFTFKKSIANLNKKDFHYLMQDIPESICIHRIRSGKGVDGLKLNNTITNFVKKEIEKENSKSNKGKLDYCKTLNDYYKKYGITDEELTNANKSANQGKKYFEEFTTITKVNEEKYIFEIKSTLKYRHDLPAYAYFTSNLLIYLKHKKKQTKQEIQNNLVIAEGPSFDNIKEYIHEYLSEIKSSHIITKDLILNLNLPKRYEYFLLNEFVINKDGSMSLDEEAKHFNMDSMELCKILVDAIKLVKENVISKMNHFTDTAALAEKKENKKTLS